MSQLDAIEQERAKIKAQLAELDKKEAAILKEERPAVISRINTEIARYKIKPHDLTFDAEGQDTRKIGGNRSPKQAPAKYRNATGELWSGRGTAPKWMPANKAEWDKYLIPKA